MAVPQTPPQLKRRWTCRGCGTVWPRTKQRCSCGRARPPKRVPKHRAILGERPYEWWVAQYGEVCGICGRPPGTKRLDRDHDHRTGQPRGLLCNRCNRALPNWVGPEWLAAAGSYLTR